MIRNLRRAEKETKKRCKVAMDLAGPKLRTGSIEPGPAVLKYRPQRDACGRVVAPARIWLTSDSIRSSTSQAECRRAGAPTLAGVPEIAGSIAFQRRAGGVSFNDHLGS